MSYKKAFISGIIFFILFTSSIIITVSASSEIWTQTYGGIRKEMGGKIVADSDGGFVILDLEGPNKEYGVIAGLGVIPRYQRRGLGTIIGLAAWEYFKKKGIKELRCEVYKDNKISYDFISSLGFEEYDVKVYKSEDFELD